MDGKAVKKTKANCSDTTEGPSERQKNQWLGLARLAICVAREGWQGLCKGGTRTAAAVRGGAWVTVWPLATGHVCCREEETAEGERYVTENKGQLQTAQEAERPNTNGEGRRGAERKPCAFSAEGMTRGQGGAGHKTW